MKWRDDPGKKNLTTGMHRINPASETVARILAQKHRFGVTRLANVTGLDRIGVPVALAIRPNSRSVAVSQGKGMTLDHAKASALMEAVEIWHAETFDGPLIHASFADLDPRHATINVGRLPERSGDVFTETARILWAEAYELNSGETRLVPFEMLHTDYTDTRVPGNGLVPCSTNGLASGNHPLEAICHGICEVIERVWEAARERGVALRRVPPESIDAPDCLHLLSLLEAAGIDCTIWDMTTDIGIATFTAVITERSGETAFTNETLLADLDLLLASLNRVSIDEVAVVDLSRADTGISVMRVIVPGLEAPHDDDLYVPGPRAEGSIP